MIRFAVIKPKIICVSQLPV